jgi:Cu2+-exporting ATPase
LVLLTQSIDSPLETIALDVSGMKCAGCVKTVENQLSQHPGVVSATVNLVTEMAVVACKPDVDPIALASRLTEAGFPTQSRSTQTDAVQNEAIAHAKAEQRQFAAQQQVQQLAIAGTLLLLSAIGHLGQWGWVDIPGISNIWFHAGLATAALLGPGRSMLVEGWQGARQNAPNMNTLVSLGTLTAYLTSVIALLFPSLGWECFFDEPVMLVGFILLGRTLEQRARNRAIRSFESLLALQPNIARLITTRNHPLQDEATLPSVTSQVVEIPADRVKLGEWLQVLPGDRIPVDGKVVLGQTTVDESMLTGEFLPIQKQVDDWVAAGTLNQSGAIAIQATRTGKDTTLAQIIALVEAAQTRKAPIQRLADTVAGYFTYGVMAIALLTFLFWYGIGTHLWAEAIQSGQWSIASGHALFHSASMMHPPSPTIHPSPLLISLKLAIAVLVVACPCALGLATPTAILVGSSLGAERGILIRGGDVLENVHHLDTVIFDKTGTLTCGQPTVTDCIPLPEGGNLTAVHLLQVAATVESGTRHPLAVAIQAQAQAQNLPLLSAQNFYTEPGLGIFADVRIDEDAAEPASVGYQSVILGNPTWLAKHDVEISLPTHTLIQTLAEQGKSVVLVAIADQLVGLIATADLPRADAKATVEALQNLGLQVKLLTGDRQATAHPLAITLGLAPEDILAEVQPGEKAHTIRQLQAAGQQVAMVGDGINDAPALAQANIGIALRSGTEVAVETAEIILMHDRLLDVVESIRLSLATFRKIRQNLFWAFAYNILGIPLAAGFFLPVLGFSLSPAAAGAMMAFSSVSVVTNSLLLRRVFSVQSNESP